MYSLHLIYSQLQDDSKSMIWFVFHLCLQMPYELVAKRDKDVLMTFYKSLVRIYLKCCASPLMFPFHEGTWVGAHNQAELESVTLELPFQSCCPVCQLAYENELNWFIFHNYSNNCKSTTSLQSIC